METRISSFLFPSSSIKMLNFFFFFQNPIFRSYCERKVERTRKQKTLPNNFFYSLSSYAHVHHVFSVLSSSLYWPHFFFHSKRSDNCCPVMFKHVFFFSFLLLLPSHVIFFLFFSRYNTQQSDAHRHRLAGLIVRTHAHRKRENCARSDQLCCASNARTRTTKEELTHHPFCQPTSSVVSTFFYFCPW